MSRRRVFARRRTYARRSGKRRGGVDLPDKNNYESNPQSGSHPVTYVAQQLREQARNKHLRINDPISEFRKIEGNKDQISKKEQSSLPKALQVTTKPLSLTKLMSGAVLAIQQPTPDDKLAKITSLSYSSSTNKPPKSGGRNKNNSPVVAKEQLAEKRRFSEFPETDKRVKLDAEQPLSNEQIIALAKQVSAPFVKRKKVLHICTPSVVPDDDDKEKPKAKRKTSYYCKHNKKMMLCDDYEQVPEVKSISVQQYAEMSLPKVPKAPEPSEQIKEEKVSKMPIVNKSVKIIKKPAKAKFIEPLHEINFFENTNPFTAISKVSCSQAARKSLTKLNEEMKNSARNDTEFVISHSSKDNKMPQDVKINKKMSTTKIAKSRRVFGDKNRRQRRRDTTKLSKNSRAIKAKHDNLAKEKKRKLMEIRNLVKSGVHIAQTKLSDVKNNKETAYKAQKTITKTHEPKFEEPNDFLSKDDCDRDACLYYKEKSPQGSGGKRETKANFRKLSSLKPEDKPNIKRKNADRFSQLSPTVVDKPKRRDKPDVHHEYPNFDYDDDIQPISQTGIDQVLENAIRKSRSAPSRDGRVTSDDKDTMWMIDANRTTKAHTKLTNTQKRKLVKPTRSKTRRRKID